MNMIKDTFFSAPRFVNLCRKEMVESWKSNVLRVVLMYGLMAIILILNGYYEYNTQLVIGKNDPVWTFALVMFMCCLCGFGCLSASFTMEKMKTKTSRLSVLMTPATSFEKFASRWLVSTFVFLIVFLIAFKLADYTRVLIYSLVYPEIKVIAAVPLSHWIGGNHYSLFSTVGDFVSVIVGYFFFQSCFVLGSSIWPKNAFLKTFVAGVLVIVVYGLILSAVGNALFDTNDLYSFDRSFSKDAIAEIKSVVCMLLALMNWILAYFRFKESEIINRM